MAAYKWWEEHERLWDALCLLLLEAQSLVIAAAAAFSAEVASGAKRAGRKARPIPLGPATDIDAK
jgi:hypothetical protein